MTTCAVEGCNFNETGECASSLNECLEHSAQKQLTENIPHLLTVQNKLIGGLMVVGVFLTVFTGILFTSFKYTHDMSLESVNRDIRIDDKFDRKMDVLSKQISDLTNGVSTHKAEVELMIERRMNESMEY